jgi:hypothetical protein
MGKLYWLAGLIEGEGCFSPALRKGWPEYYNPRIRIEMTDKDTLIKASLILYGNDRVTTCNWANKRFGHKVIYKLDITGQPAMDWMIMLYPMMSSRRQEKIKDVYEKYQNWIKHSKYKHRRTTPRYIKLVS